jgi:hypothetical protein
MIHRNNGRPDSALVYLRRAIALSRAAQLRGFQMAGLFNSVGAIFSSLNQPDSALAYLQPALHLMRAAGYRAGESLVLSDIGSTFLRLGRADSAMTYERLALPLARATGYREVEANALFEMGLASMLRRELTGALSYFDSSAAIFARVRRSAGGDANSIGYTEQRFALYPVWATTWLGAARFGMVDSARAVAAALAVSERGRAQALRDLLRRGAAATDTIAGADLVAEGNALLAPLRRSHTAVLSYLFLGDGLITWLLLPSGELRLLGTRMVPHDSLASTVAIVRGALGADSLRGGASAERESAVGLGLQIPRSSADVDRARSALSRMLSLPDVERALPDHNTELVIIPQGVLGLVPFAALPVSPSMMLSERFSLRFSPSIAFLANEGDSVGDRARGLRPALVVGNPTMPRGSMRALPAAEQEARSVARTLGAEPLTGAAATEAVVRHAMGDARVVHLATHGLAYGSDARVRDSYIALAPDAGDDGLLTVGELLDDDRLHLRAELVVLSACQTGLGDLKQAEGTVGLQRAFLAKGARSLLVSLWSVDDRATALLMTRFYAHWLHDSDHPDKAESLRRAQSDVRRTRGFADPRYWAAFQLVGAR